MEKTTERQTVLEKNNPHQQAEYERLFELDEKMEHEGWAKVRAIKDKYKQLFWENCLESGVNPEEIFELPKALREQMDAEIAAVEAEYTVDGVCFLYCQLSEVLKAYQEGRRVEIEAFGPYLRYYIEYIYEKNLKNITLTEEDKIGLAILDYLINEVMPEAHVVSLFDEYNLGEAMSLPEGTPVRVGENPGKGSPISFIDDTRKNERTITGVKKEIYAEHREDDKYRGEPWELRRTPNENTVVAERGANYLKKGRLVNESETLRKAFRTFVEMVLRQSKILKKGEEEGVEKDFVLVSETDKIEDAKKLVKIIENQGKLRGDPNSEDGELWFQNSVDECEDPRYMRIRLRDAEGHWECAALDASGYLDREDRAEENQNRNITSVVILESGMKDQRHQVWELVRSIKDENGKQMYDPLRNHDISFDKKIPPEVVVGVFKKVLNPVR